MVPELETHLKECEKLDKQFVKWTKDLLQSEPRKSELCTDARAEQIIAKGEALFEHLKVAHVVLVHI